MTHLISSIFLIFALCLRLVKTSAAVAVPRTMMTTPTNTLVPALYTEPRLEAAAWRNLSLDAEHDNNQDCSDEIRYLQTYVPSRSLNSHLWPM